MPAPIPIEPRVDPTAGDMATMIALGEADPQPVASPDPPAPPTGDS